MFDSVKDWAENGRSWAFKSERFRGMNLKDREF